MNKKQDYYGVIGNPIAHSKSPMIHALFAEETQQNLKYSAILSPIDGFKEIVHAFKSGGGLGLNITVPFKLQAFDLAEDLSTRAKLAGAVNTLKIDENSGAIFGDNTDGIGLVRDITYNLNYNLKDKKILIIGAGGASRGVIYPIFEQNPESIIIVNRTLSKAEDLATQFKSFGNIQAIDYNQLNSSHQQFDVVMNASASSLNNELPPLPKNLFKNNALAYDMMYGKSTLFMQFAESQGVQNISDGLGMLVEQAGESFFLWRNIRPNTQKIITTLKNKL